LSHLCQQTCKQTLPCGHECGDICHSDKCSDCRRITSNERVYCACRDNFIEPPIYCGTTVPKCTKRCHKMMKCGHECDRLCHLGECNVCKIEIETKCSCLKDNVTVKCMESITKNRCDKLCGESMQCGHACQTKCHDHTVDIKKCTNKCLKYKSDRCNHLCGRQCHFDGGSGVKCEDHPCQVYSAVMCKCSNLHVFTKCKYDEMKYKESGMNYED